MPKARPGDYNVKGKPSSGLKKSAAKRLTKKGPKRKHPAKKK